MTNKKTAYYIVTTLFVAIVLLQMLIPWLGIMPLGAFIIGASATIIQFTVALSGIILGPKYGAVVGFFWGGLSFINALTHPGTIGSLMFQNPATAFIPRILVGLVIGWLFNYFLRQRPIATRTIGLGILGVLAALVNTVGVVILTTIGFTVMHTNFTGIPNHNILSWLIGIVSFNAIFEMIVGFILVMLIGNILLPIAERAGIKG
ncbi:ECF transporter S component [Leuconostoc citreum]|uniref:ECF transporter S component n=1 Tax=Leuconostoc citreum TaxID=33964 RepID=UPI0002465F96|nr:ECF transporter S component [Leuconostoc citreum]MCS8587169.1 ECF transporter S component [Leuconostoc citreum]MCS8595427.1 ECF transporter S component [Leuconostoc citreum]MCS8600068.1 ECF transporter S component [Leuconostoc citreum]MDY5161360.1 ECF transporter S component [Leuconostoc citreum]MDY5165031.1 ECF transporter S component [Leuconostoc citreum]